MVLSGLSHLQVNWGAFSSPSALSPGSPLASHAARSALSLHHFSRLAYGPSIGLGATGSVAAAAFGSSLRSRSRTVLFGRSRSDCEYDSMAAAFSPRCSCTRPRLYSEAARTFGLVANATDLRAASSASL